MMKQLTGAQIVLECLKEQGVDTVFGYPGGAILNIYDELYKQNKDFTFCIWNLLIFCSIDRVVIAYIYIICIF